MRPTLVVLSGRVFDLDGGLSLSSSVFHFLSSIINGGKDDLMRVLMLNITASTFGEIVMGLDHER